MAREWSEERWIKVFLVDSPRWLSLSWQARGLYVLLQRLCDRDGYVDLGPDSTAALSAILRAPEDEIRDPLRELHRSGLVVECGQALELPEHRDQQASRASGAARQRQYRQRVTRSDEGVTRSNADKPSGDVAVTRSDDKNRIDQNRIEKREQSAREGADPKAVRISELIAANKKFASIPSLEIAEDLLAHLGVAGFNVSDEQLAAAVAEASVQVETGATEGRMRQILAWKFSNLKKPTWKKDGAPRVQGDGQTSEAVKKLLEERVKPAKASKADFTF